MNMHRAVSILKVLCLGAGALLVAADPAYAQLACPADYAACDTGGCCLSSEKCCPSVTDGCCSPYVPYCCGNGTCAASPSECMNAGQARCADYQIPCGSGCAPPGSDCCDEAGHYCPPTMTCESETTCLLGLMEEPVLLVTPAAAPVQPGVPTAPPSPFTDPPNARSRSCELSRGVAAPSSALCFAGSALFAAMCLRRRRAR
jgi:hypothetical protein